MGQCHGLSHGGGSGGEGCLSKCIQEVEGAQLKVAEGEVRNASQVHGLTGKEGAEGGADPTGQPREGTDLGAK